MTYIWYILPPVLKEVKINTLDSTNGREVVEKLYTVNVEVGQMDVGV